MKRWGWLLALALAGVTVSAVSVTASADEKTEKHEKEVKLDQIPKPARDTILREAAGAPIMKVQEETEKNQTLYEAKVKKGDEVLDVKVDAKGALIDKHTEKK
jgi:hypothetical protein